MFRHLQDIQGMQVISLAEGRILGLVQKVYLNPAKKCVAGILIREHRFGSQESWVDIQDVEMVGENVIFVNRAGVCKAKGPVGRSLKDLLGLPVTSKDGRILGSLVDLEIDENWRVTELNLSEGALVKVDPRTAVFGQDAILLGIKEAGQIKSVPQHKGGFLSRIFGRETVLETASAISRAERSGASRKSQRGSARGKKSDQ